MGCWGVVMSKSQIKFIDRSLSEGRSLKSKIQFNLQRGIVIQAGF
jgi:hypothetical protein